MPSFLLHITSNLSAEPVSSIFKTPAESDRFAPPPSYDSGPSHHPLLLGHCTRLFLISQFPPFDPHPPPSSLFLSQAKTVPPPPPKGAHALIPENWGYVALCGKRDLANGVKVKDGESALEEEGGLVKET